MSKKIYTIAFTIAVIFQIEAFATIQKQSSTETESDISQTLCNEALGEALTEVVGMDPDLALAVINNSSHSSKKILLEKLSMNQIGDSMDLINLDAGGDPGLYGKGGTGLTRKLEIKGILDIRNFDGGGDIGNSGGGIDRNTK